jgi:hypothetical protein
MASAPPDRDLDVIVQHVTGDLERGDCWAVFLGRDKRATLDTEQHAMMFARLLADLQQRRVWVCHNLGGELHRLDPSHLRGCSCC